jgi:hypothetical protein
MIVKSMRHLFKSRLRMVPDDDPNPSDGGGGDDPDGIEVAKADETGKVAFDSYDKSVKLARNRGEKLRAAEAEKARLAADLQKYKDAERLAEEEKARKAGDFEKLSAADKARIAELESKLERRDREWNDINKYVAIERALGVKIPARFRDNVKLDRVELDDDGKVKESSLTKYVAELKKTYPEIMGEKKKGPGDEPPGADGGLIPYEKWAKMPYAEQKKIPLSQVEGHPAAAKQ